MGLNNKSLIEFDPVIAQAVGLRPATVFAVIKQTKEGIDKASILRILSFLTRSTLERSLKILLDRGLVTLVDYSPPEIANILRAKTVKRLGYGTLTCEWCQCRTLTLTEHHYPIPKCSGGDATVGICHNCHAEFHYLLTQPVYRHKEVFNEG